MPFQQEKGRGRGDPLAHGEIRQRKGQRGTPASCAGRRQVTIAWSEGPGASPHNSAKHCTARNQMKAVCKDHPGGPPSEASLTMLCCVVQDDVLYLLSCGGWHRAAGR